MKVHFNKSVVVTDWYLLVEEIDDDFEQVLENKVMKILGDKFKSVVFPVETEDNTLYFAFNDSEEEAEFLRWSVNGIEV